MTTFTPEEILKRIHEVGTPLIEGDTAIFVWEGETAPQIIGDFNNWGKNPAGAAWMERIERDLWTYEIALPTDAYIEYVFTSDPDEDDARMLDTHNSNQIMNGVGGVNNHFLMAAGTHSDLDRFISGIPQGEVSRHTIFHERLMMGGRRDVWLYRPPTREPVPLLLVYDGREYMRLADLTQMVANMIGLGQIRPIALAMVDNAKAGRFVEYNCSEATLMAVNSLLIPLATQHLKLTDIAAQPGTWGVLGSSMGGLMALYTGLRLPHLFGKVISQSGAFGLRLGPADPIVTKLVKDASKKDLKIWMDVGTFDTLLEPNQAMLELLKARQYDVTYREYHAGHNFTVWSDVLPDALRLMFPA